MDAPLPARPRAQRDRPYIERPRNRQPTSSLRVSAANWLRELLAEYLGPAALGLAGVLSLVSVGLAAWLGTSIGAGLAVGLLLGAVLGWTRHTRARDRYRKGWLAEREVGRALEQAVTADCCAIAHNVKGVGKAGDIDHLVATPRRVWVVETKYRRVRNSDFPRVLARLRSNVRRVAERLPPDTPVRGCLVLAYEGAAVRRERDDVLVYNNESFESGLLRELARERGAAKVVGGGVANVVWALSGGSPVAGLAEAHGAPAEDAEASATAGAGRLEEIRREYPNAYEPWSAADDAELRRLQAEGSSVGDLVSRFGRQPSAIRSRLRKLGLA